jgi:hypothetical protein
MGAAPHRRRPRPGERLRSRDEVAVSSNVGQNYPYASESEAERASAVDHACEAFEGLRDRVGGDTSPLRVAAPDERWWTWVCPADGGKGRLHVAGYARNARAVYAICDSCGKTFLR